MLNGWNVTKTSFDHAWAGMEESCLWAQLWAGIFKQSMGARNWGGIGLSYRPARLHRLSEFIPWNRFLGSRTFENMGSEWESNQINCGFLSWQRRGSSIKRQCQIFCAAFLHCIWHFAWFPFRLILLNIGIYRSTRNHTQCRIELYLSLFQLLMIPKLRHRRFFNYGF